MTQDRGDKHCIKITNLQDDKCNWSHEYHKQAVLLKLQFLYSVQAVQGIL
jgi:hypothetical protein